VERIVIQVKDEQKTQALMDFLHTLDYVETIANPDLPTAGKRKPAQDVDFFSLSGIWAGRDINLDTIRQKAWLERS
jgi:hypothetical protein